MTEIRLKTQLWVQSQIRLCDINFIPIAIRRRGDADSGSLLLRLQRNGDLSLLVKRTTMIGGGAGWMVVAGQAEVDGPTAEAYIAREIERDRDLWVVEIEDPKQRYTLDAPIQR